MEIVKGIVLVIALALFYDAMEDYANKKDKDKFSCRLFYRWYSYDNTKNISLEVVE